MRSKKLVGLVLAVSLMLLLGSAAALASSTVYKNSSSGSDILWRSGTATIRGGYAQSCHDVCNVHVRTTTSFSPYYTMYSASAFMHVTLSHPVRSQSRSACKHSWIGGKGTGPLYCSYRS